MTDLLAKAEDDQQALAAARYLNESDRQKRIDEIADQRKAWRMDAVRDAMQAVPNDLQTEVSCNVTIAFSKQQILSVMRATWTVAKRPKKPDPFLILFSTAPLC